MIVYTAIFDSYDQLKTPKVITEGWEYICFTNNPDLKSDVWDVRYINNKKLSGVKAARCIKIRWFDYVKADLVIWCDASMQIDCDLNEFVETNHKDDFTLMQHPSRNCVYYEGMACVQLKKDAVETIDRQILKYFNEGMPKHYGMVQTGVMIRNNTLAVREFCKKWFDEVSKGSCRDQLSFNYIQWKYNYLTPHLISSDILKKEFRLFRHGS